MLIEAEAEEIRRKIAFSQIKGMNVSRAGELLERLGALNDFFELPTQQLWEIIGSQKSYCTDSSRAALQEIGRRELTFTVEKNIVPLFITDRDYPTRLLECTDGPAMLFKLGDCNLNARHVISIVGTRRATSYGQRFTAELVEGLAEQLEELVIVSGLAYGIDVAAHKAAINAGVPTVGVVAHGLKTIYPADHRDIAARMVREGGAVVTEYLSNAPVHRGNFLSRNRIVAGMSDVTVIVESEEKGGAMVTASIAAAYNRDVCAAPGRYTDRFSAGPLNLIISHRAAMIRNADDLIELMNWESRASVNSLPSFKFDEQKCSPESRKIIRFLRDRGKATVNEMVAELGIPYSELSSRLMELEMDDVVVSLPGAAVALNI